MSGLPMLFQNLDIDELEEDDWGSRCLVPTAPLFQLQPVDSLYLILVPLQQSNGSPPPPPYTAPTITPGETHKSAVRCPTPPPRQSPSRPVNEDPTTVLSICPIASRTRSSHKKHNKKELRQTVIRPDRRSEDVLQTHKGNERSQSTIPTDPDSSDEEYHSLDSQEEGGRDSEWETEDEDRPEAPHSKEKIRSKRTRKPPKRGNHQFPNRTVANPNPGQGGEVTMEVYIPWKPQEMCLIMSHAPNRKTNPEDFLDYIIKTIQMYQATPQDLFSLCCMALTPSECSTWKGHLHDPAPQDWVTFARQVPNVRDQITTISDALKRTLQQPVDITQVLECKPKVGEDGPDYWDRFCSTYATFAGDTTYNAGLASPQFNALLLQCIPETLAAYIRINNMNWPDNTRAQMRRALTYYWNTSKESKPTKVKQELVQRPARPRPLRKPDSMACQMEPQFYAPGWVNSEGYGYVTHPNGPTKPCYGPPYVPKPLAPRSRAPRFNQNCFNCGDPDHWHRDCPHNQSNRGPRGRRQTFTTANPFSD